MSLKKTYSGCPSLCFPITAWWWELNKALPIKGLINHSLKKTNNRNQPLTRFNWSPLKSDQLPGYSYLWQPDCLLHLRWLDLPSFREKLYQIKPKRHEQWNLKIWPRALICNKSQISPSLSVLSMPQTHTHTTDHTHLKTTRKLCRSVPKWLLCVLW